jgi:hypothetical protein
MVHGRWDILGAVCMVLAACGSASPETTSPAAGSGSPDDAATTAEGPASIAELLEGIAGGGQPAGDLEVVYDDMHGLHGGETITLRGDGSVTARRRDPPDTPQTEHGTTATSEQVLELVTLLLDIEAWRQEVPERTLVPDESIARLFIRGAGLEASMWEFYNDLEGLGRLVRVKRTMEALVFPAP